MPWEKFPDRRHCPRQKLGRLSNCSSRFLRSLLCLLQQQPSFLHRKRFRELFPIFQQTIRSALFHKCHEYHMHGKHCFAPLPSKSPEGDISSRHNDNGAVDNCTVSECGQMEFPTNPRFWIQQRSYIHHRMMQKKVVDWRTTRREKTIEEIQKTRNGTDRKLSRLDGRARKANRRMVQRLV